MGKRRFAVPAISRQHKSVQLTSDCGAPSGALQLEVLSHLVARALRSQLQLNWREVYFGFREQFPVIFAEHKVYQPKLLPLCPVQICRSCSEVMSREGNDTRISLPNCVHCRSGDTLLYTSADGAGIDRDSYLWYYLPYPVRNRVCEILSTVMQQTDFTLVSK